MCHVHIALRALLVRALGLRIMVVLCVVGVVHNESAYRMLTLGWDPAYEFVTRHAPFVVVHEVGTEDGGGAEC